MPSPLLGAHVSIAGGLPRALERGMALGCEAIQIFVKNATQWQGRTLTAGETRAFRQAHAASPIGPLVAHASYLINLAATDLLTLRRSRTALADEIRRCHRLGVQALVVHPGAHLGAGEDRGIRRVAASLNQVLARTPGATPRVLLENTAGQGTVLGYRLEHLQEILQLLDEPERTGICLDTCHAFAAGYRLHEPRGYEALVTELERRFGLHQLGCLHLNDSRHPLGSRRDRHANIGRGTLGREAFARLLGDPRLEEIPMILETPLGRDGKGHQRDLAVLRAMAASPG